jgi:hypothetical protein
MKGRGLVLGLVVVLALGAFAFLELRRDSEEGVRTENEFLFPYNLSRVAEIRIEMGELSASIARGEDGKWGLVEGDQVDFEYVSDFVSVWGQMRFLEVVSEAPSGEDLQRYELSPPRMSVSAEITTKEGQQAPPRPPSVQIGGPLPLQRPGYYARVDGFERVVAVTPEAGGMLQGPARQLFGLESQLAGEELVHGGH